MGELMGTRASLFGTPPVEESPPAASIPHVMPKMNALFGNTLQVAIGYYGGLDFLYNQKEFAATFGTDPPILNANPVGSVHSSTTTAKQLLNFSDQCRLDVYLHACREF